MAGSTVDPDIPIGEYHLRVSQKPVTQPSQPFDGAVTQTGTETLTNKTITLPTIIAPTVASGNFDSPQLTTPTVSNFTNAQHNHSTASQGGVLSGYETVRGGWGDYTPEWGAMTTNPTFGTGATAKGRFKIIGFKTVQVDIEFTTGSSSFSGGSGSYYFTVPNIFTTGVSELGYGTVRISSVESIGSARMYDSSAATYYTGVSVAASGQNYLLVYTNQAIRPTQPFTWSTGDQINISCTYEFQ
jgi:hypothetical protein